MKSILFLIAILFAITSYSQNKESFRLMKAETNPQMFVFTQVDNVLNIQVFTKNLKFLKPIDNAYRLWIGQDKQFELSGDTLTILNKQVKFIVVDGVTYEIIRTTEIKQVEEGPIWRTYTFPQGDTTLYRRIRSGGNGITLTPNFNPITTY